MPETQELTHTISVRIEEALYDQIDELAKAENRRYTAEMARILLAEAIDARKRKGKKG